MGSLERKPRLLGLAVVVAAACSAMACGFDGLGLAPEATPVADAGPGPALAERDASPADAGSDASTIDATADAVVLPAPLTLTSSAPPPTLDLEVEGTLGWIHFGTTTNNEDSFNEKASAKGLLPRFTVTGSTDIRTYEDNFTVFRWTNGSGRATESGTRNGVYSKTGLPAFHLDRVVGTAPQRWVVYAGVFKCKALLTVQLGAGTGAPKATAVLDNASNGYARFVIDHRAPAENTELKLTWELTTAYDPNNSNVTLAAQTLAPIP
ncbi:MAG: hypothetical protein JST00_00470 [Deltaproteobacteria bacterium]|nr:hypothetical protein [Deltaproteobacteria bacterium]